jgi:uncharacterized protein YndB with AHSA1/START domain
MNNPITISTIIAAPISRVWSAFTTPSNIEKWNHAGDDWHCPKASNELIVGGKFCYTMAAKDGSMEFDFIGIFTDIDSEKYLAITLEDDRKMEVHFSEVNGQTTVIEKFEAETENPREMQEIGWQMILNNFKKHVESE